MFHPPTETSTEITTAHPHALEVQTPSAFGVDRTETEAQLDAAHRYPRNVSTFRQRAITLATLSREAAEACMYALPRGGKTITGPSVRLAEICASAWTNLQIATRVAGLEDGEIVAHGVAWDMETNVRYVAEARRRITDKKGRRYEDDMINVTGMAAQAVARRNAIFAVVPRALVNIVYEAARACAVGDARTLVDRRAEVLARLARGGVGLDRVLARVGKTTAEDIGLGELETLVALIATVRAKEITVDEAFPAPGDTSAAASSAPPAARAAAAVAKLREPTPAASPPGEDLARVEAPIAHDVDGVIVEDP